MSRGELTFLLRSPTHGAPQETKTSFSEGLGEGSSKGGRRTTHNFFSGGGEGTRARVCGAVRPRVQERDPFDPKP